MTRKRPSARVENRLLAALPQGEYKRLQAQMEEVQLERGQRMIAPEEPVREVYFPLDAMISMVSYTQGGASVETGVVGGDGMLGIPVLFGASTTPMESLVQIPGTAMRMAGKAFKKEFDRGGALYEVLLRYLHVLIIKISQTAACNRLHPMEGRLARWLLMSSDSTGLEQLPLTHEFLSEMLGVRRAAVTEAAGRLRDEGLISYHQGRVKIINRAGLQEVACECYEVVIREYDRLFPRS